MSEPLFQDNQTVHYVDQKPLPEWGNGPDGRRVRLVADSELRMAYETWCAMACPHSNTVIHKRQYSSGGDFYRRMCRGCGASIGGMIKHASIVGRQVCVESVEYFENIKARYVADRLALYEDMAAAAAARAQPVRRDEYGEYLRSDRWRRKRELVLGRASHICEGCLSRPATEVHHLTYEHLYAEFAFELIALCDACHARLHKSSGAAQA